METAPPSAIKTTQTSTGGSFPLILGDAPISDALIPLYTPKKKAYGG